VNHGRFPHQHDSQVHSAVSASSQTGKDGTFEWKSFITDDEAPGAVAGLHRVIITPPYVNGVFLQIPPIQPQTVKVSEGENNLMVTIEGQ
jgi:hypothetical protein